MRHIVLKADGNLIKAANQRAASEQTTLDEQFQLWLEEYTEGVEVVHDPEEGKRRAERSMRTIRKIQEELKAKGVKVRKYTREEMNERR